MNEYEKLKAKWRKLLEDGKAGYCFTYEELASGKFCMHISDVGGTMPCVSDIEITGFFENEKEALAYLRFASIPQILDWDSQVQREGCPDGAETYLDNYDDDTRKDLENLLKLIDDVLISENITEDMLCQIRNKHNENFTKTNPENQILAWGSLIEILKASCFEEAFEEDIADEDYENADEEERPSTILKSLLDSDKFNEDNDQHLSLAREFLERHMRC